VRRDVQSVRQQGLRAVHKSGDEFNYHRHCSRQYDPKRSLLSSFLLILIRDRVAKPSGALHTLFVLGLRDMPL
jgi:hypothetical protein